MYSGGQTWLAGSYVYDLLNSLYFKEKGLFLTGNHSFFLPYEYF